MRRLGKIFGRVLALGMGALLVLLLVCVGWRAWAQHRETARLRLTIPPGVESLEAVRLGGVEQWILVRGQKRSAPVLLMIHGGPGIPMMPFSGKLAGLERDFTVVYWDQRGAGKSYSSSLNPEEMTLEQIVSDAQELTDLLRKRFAAPKIYLCAHSWGSIPGALLVARHPELFRAYLGVSQIADLHESEQLLYRFAREQVARPGEEKLRRELEALGPPPRPSFDNARRFNSLLQKLASEREPQLSDRELIQSALRSPYYSWADLFRTVRGADFSGRCLWRAAYEANLFRQVPRLEVPVYFLQGRHDFIVTAEVTESYFRALEAPRGKHLIWFESGHFPQWEQPEEFRKAVAGILATPQPAP